MTLRKDHTPYPRKVYFCPFSQRVWFRFHVGEPDSFAYLNQGGSSTIDGVSDVNSFQEMFNALTLLGFGTREMNDMWKILAAILHLGNVRFSPEAEGSSVKVSACNRLNVTVLDLERTLSKEISLEVICFSRIYPGAKLT